MLGHTCPRAQLRGSLIASRHKVKEVDLLILQCQPVRQASNLTHVSRSLLEHSLGGDRQVLCPLLYRAPGRKILFVSGALIFVAAAQGMPPDGLALEARRACVTHLMRL